MSDALKSIGGIFTGSNAGPILSGGALGLGEIGNLLAGRQQSQEANVLKTQQDKIAGLTPADLSRMATQAEGPINQSLVQTVNNQVQGDMASRGLAEAPGVFAAGESQAIAPFVQQNYNTALQQVIAQLGLPAEYAASIAKLLPQQQNLTPAMMLFLKSLAGMKGGGAQLPTQSTGVPNLNTSGTYDFGSLTPPTFDSGITASSPGSVDDLIMAGT